MVTWPHCGLLELSFLRADSISISISPTSPSSLKNSTSPSHAAAARFISQYLHILLSSFQIRIRTENCECSLLVPSYAETHILLFHPSPFIMMKYTQLAPVWKRYFESLMLSSFCPGNATREPEFSFQSISIFLFFRFFFFFCWDQC